MITGAILVLGSVVLIKNPPKQFAISKPYSNAVTSSYTLTINKLGTGIGTVAVKTSLGQTDCKSFPCKFQYVPGTLVILTPLASNKSGYIEYVSGPWLGCDKTSGPNRTLLCAVILNSDRTVTMTFNPPGISVVPVLVLKYFPTINGRLTLGGTPPLRDGLEGADVATARQKTETLIWQHKLALRKATTYHGYKDSAATSSLQHEIIDTKEFNVPFPTKSTPLPNKPDYKSVDYIAMLAPLNVCDYVERYGVREIWVWAYPVDIHTPESTAGGPYSNLISVPDPLPFCKNSYTLLHFNYGGSPGNALESYGHRLEATFGYVASTTFWKAFVGGWNYGFPAGTGGKSQPPRRCGWTHAPPNGRTAYDWFNEKSVYSDCEDWKPDGYGQTKLVSCHTWSSAGSCYNVDPFKNADLGWKIYWMQNMPGLNNPLTSGGKKMRNWWEFIADFDVALARGRSFLQ